MTLEISKDEAAIYDRQIRVWGFEAQARMKNSSVLVLGTSGLSIELLKNLVLAGVGRLTIVDEKIVDQGALGSNFYINFDDQGRMRSEVCAEKLRILNPKVTVIAKTTFSPDLIEGHQLVCQVDATLSEMLEMNHLCRSKNVKYVSGNTFGLLGFLFFDLIKHKYNVDDTIEEIPYATLDQTFKASFEKGSKKQLLRKVSPSLLLNKVILDFCDKKGRRPCASPEDLGEIRKMIAIFVMELFPVNENLQKEILAYWNSSIPLYQVIPFVQGEIAPCTAILGGVLAQEALKIVSAKEAPVNNLFVYSGIDGEGLVHKLTPEI